MQLNIRTEYKMSNFEKEVNEGQRFQFGKNWQDFLSTLTDERIRTAETSLKEMLSFEHLTDKTFLDIGSGSGLFSLAARRLGAKVYSFDFDPSSVTCTQKLRSRYFTNDPNWIIKEGSVLDEKFLQSLDKFDIVYSWGVLHHTGNMWKALENSASLVKNNGILFIAIYNDQGKKSKFWRRIKKIYCSGRIGKTALSISFIPYFFSRALFSSVYRRKNVFTSYKKNRGMSITHDWFDWLGGYPFEVASVEDIFNFFQERAFVLSNIKTTNGLGNNQFVFTKKIEK